MEDEALMSLHQTDYDLTPIAYGSTGQSGVGLDSSKKSY